MSREDPFLAAHRERYQERLAEALTVERIVEALNDSRCGGVVTRDGEQDACNKPTTCLINDAEFGPWAACTWHAHCYGSGRMVTLAQIREALR